MASSKPYFWDLLTVLSSSFLAVAPKLFLMILTKQHTATDAFVSFAESKIVIYLLAESKFCENLYKSNQREDTVEHLQLDLKLGPEIVS